MNDEKSVLLQRVPTSELLTALANVEHVVDGILVNFPKVTEKDFEILIVPFVTALAAEVDRRIPPEPGPKAGLNDVLATYVAQLRK